MRIPMLAGGLLLVAAVALALSTEEGEVVVVEIENGSGQGLRAELWVVDLPGGTFVRAVSPGAGWLGSLRSHPRATLSRGGQSRPVRAVVVEDPGVRQAVARAMHEKYGLADRLLTWIFDAGDSVPVRLDPLPAVPAARPPARGAGQARGRMLGLRRDPRLRGPEP